MPLTKKIKTIVFLSLLFVLTTPLFSQQKDSLPTDSLKRAYRGPQRGYSYNLTKVVQSAYMLGFEQRLFKNVSLQFSAGALLGYDHFLFGVYELDDLMRNDRHGTLHKNTLFVSDDYKMGYVAGLQPRVYFKEQPMNSGYFGLNFEAGNRKILIPNETLLGLKEMTSPTGTKGVYWEKMEQDENLSVNKFIFSVIVGRQKIHRTGATHNISFEIGQQFITFNKHESHLEEASYGNVQFYECKTHFIGKKETLSTFYFFINLSFGFVTNKK